MPKESQSEKDERLVAAVDAYSESAYGSSNTDELSSSRALVIERYLGRNIDPAPEGRSQIRDRTVYETIEWIKPSLLRIFCGSDEVVKFDPQGPEDEDLAEQETAYTNYVVTQKNNWHQICHDWFSDALLLKNGYAYACWEEVKVTESEFYENLTDDGFAFIAQDDEVEIVAHSAKPNVELAKLQQQQYEQQIAQYQQAVGQMQAQQAQMQPGMQPPDQQLPPPPQQPPQPSLHDIELKRTKKKGQVRIHVLAPERCMVDINTPDASLECCNYFEWFDFKTVGQARAMGFAIPDDISDLYGYDRLDTSEETARNLYNETGFDIQDQSSFDDPTMRRIKIRYVWIRHDYNGDGIDELQYVVIIGKTVFYRRECDEIPVSSISPIPLAHRHIGMSVADTVTDIEDINSAFIRQGIDNLFFANNPRMLVSDRVNMADLLDSRPGGIVRVEGQPPQEALPLVVPDMFPNAVNAVNFFDQRRQNRTGVNAYFQGTDANTLNKTASGISQLTNSAAQRVEMIARLFAPGVTKLFSLAHKLILQHGHQKEVLRMRGDWVSIDPSEWRKRYDIRLVVGLGTGNKDSLLAQLSGMFAAQLQGLQIGVVTPQNVYHTLYEIAKASSFTTPERFATDPTVTPPPPPQKPLEITLKEMDAQIEQTKLVASDKGKKDQIELQVWQTKQTQQLEIWKTEQEAKLKIAVEQMKTGASTDIEGAKLQLESARMQQEAEPVLKSEQIVGEGLSRIEQMSQQTAEQIAQMQQAIMQATEAVSRLAQIASTPKEVVRDKAGRVVGVRPVMQ